MTTSARQELTAIADRIGGIATGVVEGTVLGIAAWHAECSACPDWRCHRQAHEDADTAGRCAHRHANRHQEDPTR
jgi:hypothetical protein